MGINVVDIVIENKKMNAVDLLVFGKRYAETIAQEAKNAGFDKVTVKQSNAAGAHPYRVLIGKKGGTGKLNEIIAFLEDQGFEFGMDR